MEQHRTIEKMSRYVLVNSSTEEIEEIVSEVKPDKLIKKSRTWWEKDEYEGYKTKDIEYLVSIIEENENIEQKDKILLEKTISKRMHPSGDYHNNLSKLNRGTFNLLLMVQNNASAIKSSYKLSSMEGLKRNGLIYGTHIKSKKITIKKGLEFVIGVDAEDIVTEETVYTYVLKLTEYGKKVAKRLARKAEEIIENDLNIYQKLGRV